MANDDSTSDLCTTKIKKFKQRQITVGRTISGYRSKKTQPYQTPLPIPWIRLQGQWLDKAGFTIGAPLTVKVMDQCLVITTEGES